MNTNRKGINLDLFFLEGIGIVATHESERKREMDAIVSAMCVREWESDRQRRKPCNLRLPLFPILFVSDKLHKRKEKSACVLI